MMDGEIAFHLAGMSDLRGLEEQDFDFLIRDRTMFHSARYDEEVNLNQSHALLAKIHPETSSQDQEEFVLLRVVMPDELALELHDLHVLPIQIADDTRVPMV